MGDIQVTVQLQTVELTLEGMRLLGAILRMPQDSYEQASTCLTVPQGHKVLPGPITMESPRA
jgi:hypothetical protein